MMTDYNPPKDYLRDVCDRLVSESKKLGAAGSEYHESPCNCLDYLLSKIRTLKKRYARLKEKFEKEREENTRLKKENEELKKQIRKG